MTQTLEEESDEELILDKLITEEFTTEFKSLMLAPIEPVVDE